MTIFLILNLNMLENFHWFILIFTLGASTFAHDSSPNPGKHCYYFSFCCKNIYFAKYSLIFTCGSFRKLCNLDRLYYKEIKNFFTNWNIYYNYVGMIYLQSLFISCMTKIVDVLSHLTTAIYINLSFFYRYVVFS